MRTAQIECELLQTWRLLPNNTNDVAFRNDKRTVLSNREKTYGENATNFFLWPLRCVWVKTACNSTEKWIRGCDRVMHLIFAVIPSHFEHISKLSCAAASTQKFRPHDMSAHFSFWSVKTLALNFIERSRR